MTWTRPRREQYDSRMRRIALALLGFGALPACADSNQAPGTEPTSGWWPPGFFGKADAGPVQNPPATAKGQGAQRWFPKKE